MESAEFVNIEAYVTKRLLEDKISKAELSQELQSLFPGKTGFSVSSINRYCQIRNIRRRGTVSDETLINLVRTAIAELGPNYGIRPMQGYLRSKGYSVSLHRVADVMRVANPSDAANRRITMGRRRNPIPYSAESFADKFHLDQNEKLVDFGVTSVIMVDGYSRMIIGYAVMPRKNNIKIYEEVYRPAVLKYGLCRQVRTDHGKEFDLIHYVHKELLGKEGRRTRSTKNMAVERQWVELNSKVFYPIKQCLVDMLEAGEINLESQITKHAVSAVSILLVTEGLRRYVISHNNHYIQGRGIPSQLMRLRSSAEPVAECNVPTIDTALMFAESAGHRFQTPYCYGDDPLHIFPDLSERRITEFQAAFNVSQVYNCVLQNQRRAFLNAIIRYQDLSTELSCTH